MNEAAEHESRHRVAADEDGLQRAEPHGLLVRGPRRGRADKGLEIDRGAGDDAAVEVNQEVGRDEERQRAPRGEESRAAGAAPVADGAAAA